MTGNPTDISTSNANPDPAPSPAAQLANPAPLGLLGFGMTTVLLNLHNAGLFTLGAMILAMGLFYGGLAQIIAGLAEMKKGNTFATTAFTSYGLFWLTLVFLVIAPGVFPEVAAPEPSAMAAYLAMWGLFTAWMFVSTLKQNRVLQFVFGSLALLFFMLAAADLTGSAALKQAAGIEGLICGFSAVYLAMAELTNETYRREVLPIFPVEAKPAALAPTPTAAPAPTAATPQAQMQPRRSRAGGSP